MARSKRTVKKKASAKTPSRTHPWSDFVSPPFSPPPFPRHHKLTQAIQSRPLTEADEAQIFGHIPETYPVNRSRPLTDADGALIRKKFPKALYPWETLSPLGDRFFEQGSKMRKLASKSKDNVVMAEGCKLWEKEVEMVKRIWSEWYVAIVL